MKTIIREILCWLIPRYFSIELMLKIAMECFTAYPETFYYLSTLSMKLFIPLHAFNILNNINRPVNTRHGNTSLLIAGVLFVITRKQGKTS